MESTRAGATRKKTLPKKKVLTEAVETVRVAQRGGEEST